MRTQQDVADALSLERFSRYLQWAEGSHSRALDLYALNTRVSESLHTPLQMFEVALRNRVAHHEPILHWDLPQHHAQMLEVTRWLSAAAADWCVAYSRFPTVHPAQRVVLGGTG